MSNKEDNLTPGPGDLENPLVQAALRIVREHGDRGYGALSKLALVRDALEANQNIWVSPNILSSSVHNGENNLIFIGPRQPITDPRELNEFMQDLIPGVERYAFDHAMVVNGELSFPILYYREVIVRRREYVIRITEDEEIGAAQRLGIQEGSKTFERDQDIGRQTLVICLPVAAMAYSLYRAFTEEGYKDPRLVGVSEHRTPVARIKDFS